MSQRLTTEDIAERVSQHKENMEFVRWEDGEYKNTKKSKAVLRCTIHGIEFPSTVTTLFSSHHNCPVCKREDATRKKTKPSDDYAKDFMATGKFAEGTTFTRTDRRDCQDKRYNWVVHCPVCAVDEYAQAGLCDGNFMANWPGLSKGRQSCRCGPNPTFTDEQWLFRAKCAVAARGDGLSFVGMKKVTTWTQARLSLYCDDHGDFTTSLSSFLSGSGCPSCALSGFDPTKPAHFYVLKVDGPASSFTGYGISNVIDTRLTVHKRNLAKDGFSVVNEWTVPIEGKEAYHLESVVARNFPKHGQRTTGFVREATYSEHFLDVIQTIENAILQNRTVGNTATGCLGQLGYLPKLSTAGTNLETQYVQ